MKGEEVELSINLELRLTAECRNKRRLCKALRLLMNYETNTKGIEKTSIEDNSDPTQEGEEFVASHFVWKLNHIYQNVPKIAENTRIFKVGEKFRETDGRPLFQWQSYQIGQIQLNISSIWRFHEFLVCLLRRPFDNTVLVNRKKTYHGRCLNHSLVKWKILSPKKYFVKSSI